jgi:NADH-ubiquinone oxidoreductase chain 6
MILYLSDFFIIGSNYGLFIGSILLSITSVNPIHSILSLINTFLTGSIFLVILNLVFFALIFLAVYLGAIAILFLFIVMMLDIKITNESYLLRNS